MSEPSRLPEQADATSEPPPRVPNSPQLPQSGASPDSPATDPMTVPEDETGPLAAPEHETPFPGPPETSVDTGPWQGQT